MTDKAERLGIEVDHDQVIDVTQKTMIEAAAQIINRTPFRSTKERVGALADLAEAVLPDYARIAIEIEGE